MRINVYETKKDTSKKAAQIASSILKKSIKTKKEVVYVMATGNSQLEFISALTEKDIDWGKAKMYHLDEYIGLTREHKASFRKYLNDKFITQVDDLKEINFIKGDTDNPEKECERLNNKIKSEHNLDVAFIGIGENGHIAFNDPPANFDTKKPFIIEKLNQECRTQQVNEGWFERIEEVPEKAITMSVQQILNFNHIICTVPGKRKAQAVRNCFGNDKVSPEFPASILKNHNNLDIFLDENSASLLHES